MNLLFVHDVRAEISDGKVYARSYGYNVWKERYLSSFDKITVCFRTRKTDESLDGKVDCSSGPNVKFDTRIGMFKGPEVFISSRIKDILTEDIKANDAVIVRLDSFLGLETISLCQKLNKPFLIELVGCAWDSFWNHGISGKILAPYIFNRTRDAVKNAPFVVYVTKKFLQGRYPTDGINTNISNVEIYRQSEDVLEDRLKKISEKHKKLVLGTSANVDVRYKGQQFVIEALGILKKRGVNRIEYQILGAGDQSYLKSVAQKNNVEGQVKFIGSVSHDKVADWLNGIDVYVQPSLQEGLPRSVIEAMNLGIPCMGSDVAGIPELLDEDCIFKRKGNKPLEIAKLITSFNRKKQIREAKANFEKAKEYDYPLLIKKRYDFFEKYKDYVREHEE